MDPPHNPLALAATPLATAVDVALLVVWGGLSVSFLHRYRQLRKLSSFGIALMPTGWMLLALFDLQVLRPHPQFPVWRMTGVAIGLAIAAMLVLSRRAERAGHGHR